MVIDDVPVPEMVAPELPAVAAIVPSPTDSVTDIEPEPASTSEIESPVPFSVSADLRLPRTMPA